MLINTLAALAMGYLLDLLFGDPKIFIYPQNLIKAFCIKLEKILRKAYSDTSEAQRVAGIMYFLVTVAIVGGVSAVLLMVCYKLWTVLGILVEGIMCWSAISIRSLRSSAAGVLRCVKAGNINGAQRRLKDISNRDVEDIDLDGAIKCAVETVSENTADWAVAPIFWIALLGGVGGLIYRSVNIMDNLVGYKTKEYKAFGGFSAKMDDIFTYIPARLAALLMRIDAAFLKLDSKNAKQVYKRDRRKNASPNSGQTQSVCAGALGIQLCGEEYYLGELVKKRAIGNDLKPVHPTDIYWANQLLNGTAFLGVAVTFIVRTALFFVL